MEKNKTSTRVKNCIKNTRTDWGKIGIGLKEIRLNLGLSIYHVADIAGVSKSLIWKMENGGKPTLEKFIKLQIAYLLLDNKNIWHLVSDCTKIDYEYTRQTKI